MLDFATCGSVYLSTILSRSPSNSVYPDKGVADAGRPPSILAQGDCSELPEDNAQVLAKPISAT